MFTGIIEAIGEIATIEPSGGDVRIRVKSGKLPLQGVQLGDSICTSGVCLTVVALPGDGYWADVSNETLSLTTVGTWSTGTKVNLERALTPESRLGGHIVSGHVDGIGTVVERYEEGRSWRFIIEAPAELAKYIAHKGSICIDGTSLTVNSVNGNRFDLNIIPQTMAETVIGSYYVGTSINLEVDVIARYLERLLLGSEAAKPQGLSLEKLAENGFLNR
ncbi:MAG: riboflavin synthase [Gammaproteobacteria bacterium]|jgi:riboflavin synthase|nr:riboflavin synthase [Gammaproteobacteria bacterium]